VLGKYCVGLFNSEVTFYNEKFEKILEMKHEKSEDDTVDLLNDLLFFKIENHNYLITSSRFEAEKLKIYSIDFKSSKTEQILKAMKASDEYISSLSLNILSPQFFAGGDTDGNILVYKIGDDYLTTDSKPTKRKKKDYGFLSPMNRIEKCHEQVKCIKWMNTNQIASCGNDYNIKVFNINTNSHYCVLTSQFSVPNVITSSNDYLFSGHEDGKVRLWDLRSPGKPSLVFNAHDSCVSDIKISPLSNQLFSSISYDKSIKFFDLRASKPLWKLNADCDKNFALEFNSSNYLLTGGESSNVNIYEIKF